MAFSEQDRDRVRQATNLVDLISAITTVKRSGRNVMAVCPFHQEKTPSMSVDVARGLYYCHGCHSKGDIFTFVQETQGLTFPEALEVLASQAGITLTEDPTAARRRGQRHALVEATRQAIEFYHRTLMKSPEAGVARSYLRSRGYDADTVATYRLGYAPPAGDALVRELRSQAIEAKVLIEAGDYFRDRLLFPTNDVRGDPVGFGGRILGEGQPKYLNTPETPIYKKSHLLYGLDRARREIQKSGYSVVVEGYTDVIALQRHGVPEAVATNGTALGDDHFELLRRFYERIVLAFDADAAGGRAALRGDDLAVPVSLDLDLRVAELPAGVDPAEMVQTGRVEELHHAIERARPLLQFRIERELAEYDLSEPESRARALRALGPRVARVTDDLARTEYARFLAERMGIDLGTVEHAMGRPRRRRSAEAGTSRRRTGSGRERIERELLMAVLTDGGAALAHGVGPEHFTGESMKAAFGRIAPLVAVAKAGEPIPLGSGEDETGALLIELAFDDRKVAPIQELIDRLATLDLDDRMDRLSAEIEAMSPDDEGYSQKLRELTHLQQQRKQSRE
jgi:DNA primase